jgi:hypothetical protein
MNSSPEIIEHDLSCKNRTVNDAIPMVNGPLAGPAASG